MKFHLLFAPRDVHGKPIGIDKEHDLRHLLPQQSAPRFTALKAKMATEDLAKTEANRKMGLYKPNAQHTTTEIREKMRRAEVVGEEVGIKELMPTKKAAMAAEGKSSPASDGDKQCSVHKNATGHTDDECRKQHPELMAKYIEKMKKMKADRGKKLTKEQ